MPSHICPNAFKWKPQSYFDGLTYPRWVEHSVETKERTVVGYFRWKLLLSSTTDNETVLVYIPVQSNARGWLRFCPKKTMNFCSSVYLWDLWLLRHLLFILSTLIHFCWGESELSCRTWLLFGMFWLTSGNRACMKFTENFENIFVAVRVIFHPLMQNVVWTTLWALHPKKCRVHL